jgi:hypothetical protein
VRKSSLFMVLGATFAPMAAPAHGINGHVHVTGWAIERLPPGELADFFAEQAVRDAALIGAAFPDSGYAIDDHYGELAHWEPYVGVHLAWLRERFPPPLVDLEAKKQLAFLMGLAAHGLQDEMFDSVFLYELEERDGAGQERSDPGTDAFLFTDGWLQYKPPLYAPFEDLPEIFLRAHGHAVTPSTLRSGMNRVKVLVIDGFHALAPVLDAEHRPHLPWTAQHYVDPAVPGSLAAEIPATGAHLQAIWDRFHGRFGLEELAVHTWPDVPRRLRGTQPGHVDGWITLIFATGVRVGSLTPETVLLTDADGLAVPVRVVGTRWGGSPEDSSRLVRLQPEVELAPNAAYTVTLHPGVALLDGQTLQNAWSFSFLTACVEGDPACPPEPTGGEPPRPPVAEADAGVADAGVADAEVDVEVEAEIDAEFDAGAVPDARLVADATPPDATRGDTAPDRSAQATTGDTCSVSRPANSSLDSKSWPLLCLGLLWAQRLRARRKPTGR